MNSRGYSKSILVVFCVFLVIFSFFPAGSFIIDNKPAEGITDHVSGSNSFDPEVFSGTKNVTLFSNPDSANDTIRKFLGLAQSSIHLEIYSISNWFLLKDLIDAKQRNSNMDIKVIISYNRASASENSYTWGAALNLTRNGIEVYRATKDLGFTHAKFWIIDGETVFVYSGNWAKSSVSPHPSDGNREWGIAVHDSDVASYYEDVFFHDLSLASSYVVDETDEKRFTANIVKGRYDPIATAQNLVADMSLVPILSPDNYVKTIKELLQSANSTLDLELQYIKHEDGNVSDLVSELIAARRRNVTIRVILMDKDAADAVGNLTVNGILVAYINTTLFNWNHNKGIIVDEKITVISSTNWSFEGTSKNREAGIIIYNKAVADYFFDLFNYDWQTGSFQGGGNYTYTDPPVGESTTTTNGLPGDLTPGLDILTAVIILTGLVILRGVTKKRKK